MESGRGHYLRSRVDSIESGIQYCHRFTLHGANEGTHSFKKKPVHSNTTAKLHESAILGFQYVTKAKLMLRWQNFFITEEFQSLDIINLLASETSYYFLQFMRYDFSPY